MDRHSRRTAPFFFRYLLAGCLILAGGVLPQLAQAADPDGSLDTSFNTGSGLGGSQPVYAVATGEDGRLVVAGFFSSYNGTVKNNIARLNVDGSLDSTFNSGSGVDMPIESVAIQSDGKLLLGGQFTTFRGVSRKGIARVNTDGSIDSSFYPGVGPDTFVKRVMVLPDGKLIAAGYFTKWNGITKNRIVRLNADGTLDNLFNSGGGASDTIQSMVLQNDGKILIVGQFLSYAGISRNRIARLNMDGSLDTGFNPGTGIGGSVTGSALQLDGKILIAGSFSTYNGNVSNHVARLHVDGTLDSSFSLGNGLAGPYSGRGDVYSLKVQPDGKIIIGGNFTSLNGIARNGLARLNADGTLDVDFVPGSAFSSVWSLAIRPNGTVVVGGSFIGGAGNGLAVIHTGDADNDGIENAADYFSGNPAAARDFDKDGKPDAWLQPNPFSCVVTASTCNGLTLDNDDDNDGIVDASDAFPLNAYESLDTDGDGIGNNGDVDDDGDGVLDYVDPEPVNAANSTRWSLNGIYKGGLVREIQSKN